MRDGKWIRNTGAFALIILIVMTALAGCSDTVVVAEAPAPLADSPLPDKSGEIYLYGEQHGEEAILNREAELWYEHYHNENMRHLFIEMPYYTSEFLNLWMQAENDDILNAVYGDWEGAAAHNPYVKAFYQRIKRECPQTIFHGTDVGHQYSTTGERFLADLEKRGLKDSEQYQFTQKVIEQGKRYYGQSDNVYRENMMVENFIYEFDKLGDESVMGIYGGAHIRAGAMDSTGTVLRMAGQLRKVYGEALHSEDLTWMAKETDPLRKDTITTGDQDYEALYFGKEDMTGFRDFVCREFWRLEHAYDDFKDRPKTGDVLPYDNYPTRIEQGQIFVIDYTKTDGSVMRKYYRSDGAVWEGMQVTEEFTIE